MTTMALPKHNITVTVPDGFSNHGNDDLFCLPATWYQIATFFLINYGSHAVTIRSRPGQTYYHAGRDIMYALLCPFSGVRRAIDSFGRSSWPSENQLIKAARAGALCIVVRNQEWQATRDSHIADKTSEQRLAGPTTIQEVQSGASTDEPSNQLAGATSIQEIQSGDSTDKLSNQLAGATSVQGVRKSDNVQAQFDETKDRKSADQIEVYEDVQRKEIGEDTDPRPPGLSMDPKVTPVNSASEGHE